jgi:hypothetical protein
MSQITYKSQGAGVSTETSGAALSPLCPATVDAGDILIAHVFWEGTTSAPSTPSGWTLLNPGGTAFVIETTIARQWFFGRIADGSEDGAAVAFGNPAVTTQRAARIYSFSGRVAGLITDLIGGITHTSNANDPQGPSVTTPSSTSRAVALVAQNDNNALAAFAGATGGTWSEAVAEYTVALTPGFSLGIQTCVPTSNPGTVSGGSDNTTNDPCGTIGFWIKDTNAQTITPSGIATAEAFGTGKVNLKISPSGIASAETFGTTKVNMSVQGAGNVGTAEAFGTAVLTQGVAGQTISPSAIASGEAFGTLKVNLKIFPSSVASGEAFGTTKVNQTIAPTGIASAETVGTPKVNLTIAPAGIASGEAFGTTKLNQVIVPSGIASAETFGTSKVNLKISASGIASLEAFGTASVSATAGAVQPSGIASGEAFGTPKITVSIVPNAIPSDEAFGTPSVRRSIAPAGIPSSEAFGNPKISLSVAASGITTGEAFGTPRITIKLVPVGITSGEAFGSPTLTPTTSVRPSAIPSAEAFGTLLIVTEGPQTISVPSIQSEERVGSPDLGQPFSTTVGGTSIQGIFPLEQVALELDAITQLKSGRGPTRRRITITSGQRTKVQLQIMSKGQPLDLGSMHAELKYFKSTSLKQTLATLSSAASPGVLRATVDGEGIAPGEYFAEVSIRMPAGGHLFAPGSAPLTLVVL